MADWMPNWSGRLRWDFVFPMHLPTEPTAMIYSFTKAPSCPQVHIGFTCKSYSSPK
jgi:hypothetical protein